MDSVLFEEWIWEMDTKFTKEKKKEALIIDNYPALPTINNLKSIELIFLPPNTTSKLQPVDQGVTCSLKAYYKALPLKRMAVAIDKGKDLPVFSILDAMKMLDLAWQKVQTTSTILNCFVKAGISCRLLTAKSRSTRGASHHPAFMVSCLTISQTRLSCSPCTIMGFQLW